LLVSPGQNLALTVLYVPSLLTYVPRLLIYVPRLLIYVPRMLIYVPRLLIYVLRLLIYVPRLLIYVPRLLIYEFGQVRYPAFGKWIPPAKRSALLHALRERPFLLPTRRRAGSGALEP